MPQAVEKESSSSTTAPPPPITHVLETCLMVKDIRSSTSFYSKIFHIEPFLDTPRMSGFALGQTTLLLFQLGSTSADSPMPDNRGTIPGHGPTKDVLDVLLNESASTEPDKGSLHHHFCLAVKSTEDVQAYEEWFEQQEVKVTGMVQWPRGGKSIYFTDPDGNVGEIASRGIWEHY
ncbi:Glyoxalase/Bleomycin resistance protein/Dihydroxybiphenyl dioxygenase [Exophiala viscosa]|uniref:Glyoxalase/Bleomycin resistance protein/Dihydroxybiphenyl dioxygenase n=1 Tax=Exophiala viscosa TaxID=2486360 RepID=A0AAN6DY99_9EURO|nr:Glyoxalase/Bleomycin resistance protein/Dihydroxybiphenyl dioxygenase [Exophiala viscosa]KAI1624243.1 Glyoxalase/Bleomycin resistance protein/Dihydroxybiphenyl dioxygenase [Exophiala viscosa]